jgi:hypothetical protein
MDRPTQPIVLILRFRDLNPPDRGNTIGQHNSISQSAGSVWWGWWRKQNETVPVQLWSDILKQVEASKTKSVRVFLLDSGQRILYTTSLFDIRYPPNGITEIQTPDMNATPSYYRGTPADPIKFASWFRLGAISEADPLELNSLAYLVAPHDDLASLPADSFINTRLGDIDKLLTFGNMTYWVGTPASLTSASALDPKIKVLPPWAPRDVVYAHSHRILHLSDIHVAAGKHAFRMKDGDAHNLTLSDAIYSSMRGELPGLVIVSGDLTWSGARAEFDSAFQVLSDLRSKLGLGIEHFIIIPGNHDIQWTTDQAKLSQYKHEGIVEIAPQEARANYVDFFRRWYGCLPNEHLSIGRRCFLAGGPTIDIIGLNSSSLLQIPGQFAGLGRITEHAIDRVTDEMGWTTGRRATQVRIVVTHHHVLPVYLLESPADAVTGFGIALDAGSLLSRASSLGVDLILHGHKHHPFSGFHQRVDSRTSEDSPKGISVLGAGSAGVVDEYVGPIRHRSFNIIEMSQLELKVEVFATHSSPSEFQKTNEPLFAAYGSMWRKTQ